MENQAFEGDKRKVEPKKKSKISIIPVDENTKTNKIPNVQKVLSPKEEKKRLKAEKKRLKKEKEEEEMERRWEEYSKKDKILYVLYSIIKIIIFIILLYLFLLSLNFMTIGFTLVSPYALKAGDAIRFLLENPFAALSIGIIVTAILQNATATTSIAVTMVGAGIIPSVKSAIPIIMGSNIGTCVTNSFIALTLSGDPNEFKRAFSAATLNDVFNFLTTAVLITIEIASNFLFVVSEKLSDLMPSNTDDLKNANFVGAIINPLCDLFIKIDGDAVDAVNQGSNTTQIALRCCEKPISTQLVNNTNLTNSLIYMFNITLESNRTILLKNLTNLTEYQDYFFVNTTLFQNKTGCVECGYWCMPMLRAFGDGGTGLFWIIISLIVLLGCLFGIVKVLSLLIVGPIAHGVRKAINASFPGKMKWFTEVVLFIVSFLLTLIVQSSNIITATLVPLCGIGIVTLKRVYVMTLGSNVGTTVTGILSAFTQPASALKKSLQLAFVYTLFNVLGVVFWLPIPFLRLPIVFATKLGEVILKYKWFLYVYVGLVYFILPLIVLGLALIPYWIGLAIFGIPILILFAGYLILLILRKFIPRILPEKLKSFDWLPEWMRSLGYWDKKVKNINFCPCKKKKKKTEIYSQSVDENQETNIDEENESNFIPNIIRRFSAIDSVIREARVYSRRNTIVSNPDLSGDEHHKDQIARKKLSVFKIDEDSTERF
ncbi:unnamed protein product [Brachionus calyciflorus]|uniref:Uncharacterized protein n=1 Tax=Brachionus calyciflorus TaxID=104777 RepID=A0A814B322_9BILA|nr:unnamed protein product [Brachionus calyciflorus]